MHSYSYRLAPDTLGVLEILIGEPASAAATSARVTITSGSRSIVIQAEAETFESYFECFRLTAKLTTVHPLAERIELGKVESIDLLTAEEWIVDGRGEEQKGLFGRIQAYAESGLPGRAPAEALATCQADEGILITGTLGSLLVHCDRMAYTVIWSTDEDEIRACLAERQALRVARAN